MAVRIPSAPPSSLDALRTVASSLANSASVRSHAPQIASEFSRTPTAPISPVLSYRVYVLSLEEVAAQNANLGAVKVAFWRHTIESDGEIATADVRPDETGNTFTFAAISFGPWPANVKNAIDELRSAPDLEASSYQASLLQIPALNIRAIWLEGSPGLIVPLAPARPELTAGRRYSEQEFLNALQAAARRMLASDDPRKGA